MSGADEAAGSARREAARAAEVSDWAGAWGGTIDCGIEAGVSEDDSVRQCDGLRKIEAKKQRTRWSWKLIDHKQRSSHFQQMSASRFVLPRNHEGKKRGIKEKVDGTKVKKD